MCPRATLCASIAQGAHQASATPACVCMSSVCVCVCVCVRACLTTWCSVSFACRGAHTCSAWKGAPGIELYTADVPSLSSARGPEPPAPILLQRAPPGAPHSAAICNMYIISHHIIIEFTEVVECVQFYI